MFVTVSVFYRLTENAELLKRRLKSLEDSREQLDRCLKEQIAYNRTLEREMQKLKPEIQQLQRQKDKHVTYVLQCFFLIDIILVRISVNDTIMFQMVEEERYESKQNQSTHIKPFTFKSCIGRIVRRSSGSGS